MSLSIKEWEKEIEKLTKDEKIIFHNALDALYKWDTFKEHFTETQCFLIKNIIEYSKEV